MSRAINVPGILEMHTVAMELHLPKDKLNRLRTLLQGWQPRKACQKKTSVLGRAFVPCLKGGLAWLLLLGGMFLLLSGSRRGQLQQTVQN